jgi:hypothetical protein
VRKDVVTVANKVPRKAKAAAGAMLKKKSF